ncbi:CCAAT/enhancer-binding protein zeta-like [Euwallacea fornicatus]|uniref:CCAAT/enhancer-binding protein zeta-like n=1 Tax=Euwallacea fornicatus TaxID=995702 RepID=UPI00338DCFC8
MKFNKKNRFKSAPKPPAAVDNYELSEYKETGKWYQEKLNEPKTSSPVTEQVLIELKEEAQKCHEAEVANYNIKNSKTNSNFQWMKTLMVKGTVSDKIAAHTVAIQNNPVCNLEMLRNMVNMVKVGKKNECFTVMETLTELFLSELLKPNQKLIPFHSKPLSMVNEMSSGNGIKRRKILSLWHFEDQLKEVFSSFVLALNRAAQDTVDSNKEKAIAAMFKLLSGNPEQEKNLLSNIINKLGDPSQKVASKAIYCLTQLLFKHPNMQEVVLKEVEKILFRPNVGTRAQYYCLCFLSQFYLSHEEPQLAKKVIDVYLAFFKACVKKGEVDSRMMSALLMGINRAYPYAKLQFDDMSSHVDTLYRLAHMTNFNIALQVLMLLFHVTGEKMADRYYSTLYKKLGDCKLLTTTHQAMLLSLLYKSLLKDTQSNRTKMFIKRLLQISLFVQPSFSCGVLYLVSQLLSKKPELRSLALDQLKSSDLDRFEEGEDKYYDIKEEEDNVVIDDEEDEKPDLEVSFKGSSWVHSNARDLKPIVKYNPLVRNPLYGGGQFAVYTELRYLVSHFHPTVALWAESLLKDRKVDYIGDPLKDFTLIRFLDRFVFKNPKSLEDRNGAHPTFGKRKFYKPKGIKILPVTSASYLSEVEENIPVDERFLYSYLQKKFQNKSQCDQVDSDLESVQSEEFEEMLDKMAGIKDNEDDELDYLGEIGDSLKKKKKSPSTKVAPQDSEEEQENDLSDDDNDEELKATEEDLDLMDDLSEGDVEEDIEFPSDSEEESSFSSKKKQKDTASLFASAEEFAALLDDEGSSKQKPGTSSIMANKDKASQRQLDWETNRNNWIKGFDKAISGKKFSKKRPNKGKMNHKNKKFKTK